MHQTLIQRSKRREHGCIDVDFPNSPETRLASKRAAFDVTQFALTTDGEVTVSLKKGPENEFAHSSGIFPVMLGPTSAVNSNSNDHCYQLVESIRAHSPPVGREGIVTHSKGRTGRATTTWSFSRRAPHRRFSEKERPYSPILSDCCHVSNLDAREQANRLRLNRF